MGELDNIPVTCEGCEDCVYLEQGDYFCLKRQIMVIDNWEPVFFPVECGGGYHE